MVMNILTITVGHWFCLCSILLSTLYLHYRLNVCKCSVKLTVSEKQSQHKKSVFKNKKM